jgi:N-methylhydantoinase B/oxoprolinase/acetone carboxylase alpha subunit
MEGLFLPILRIVEEGVVNETLMSVIRANTRLPVETEGDTYALISCNEIGCERLTEMMDESGIDDLDEVSDHIIDTSKAAIGLRTRALSRSGLFRRPCERIGLCRPVIGRDAAGQGPPYCAEGHPDRDQVARRRRPRRPEEA